METIQNVLLQDQHDSLSRTLRTLVQKANGKGKNLVVCSDVKEYHDMWDRDDINERGESLVLYIISSNLIICKSGARCFPYL